MSLKDKYGINIDLNEKYSPKPKIPVTDPSKTPRLRPELASIGDYRELPRDIRVDNEIKENYLNLLINAKNEIIRYKNVFDAFKEGLTENKLQVQSQDFKYSLLADLKLTHEVYECGDWFDDNISEADAHKEYRKYYKLSNTRQDYAHIQIKTGTFSKYFDELYTDIDYTDIYFFIDGNIYCTGYKFLYNIPFEDFVVILSESIDKLNAGEDYKNFPYMEARVFFQHDFKKNIKESRDKILKYSTGDPFKH